MLDLVVANHSFVNIGKRTELITGDLVDLHLVQCRDYAFPRGSGHRFDNDYRASVLVAVTNLLGSFLELFFGDLLIAPFLFLFL